MGVVVGTDGTIALLCVGDLRAVDPSSRLGLEVRYLANLTAVVPMPAARAETWRSKVFFAPASLL